MTNLMLELWWVPSPKVWSTWMLLHVPVDFNITGPSIQLPCNCAFFSSVQFISHCKQKEVVKRNFTKFSNIPEVTEYDDKHQEYTKDSHRNQ